MQNNTFTLTPAEDEVVGSLSTPERRRFLQLVREGLPATRAMEELRGEWMAGRACHAAAERRESLLWG